MITGFFISIVLLWAPTTYAAHFSEVSISGRVDQFDGNAVYFWMNKNIYCRADRKLFSTTVNLKEGKKFEISVAEAQAQTILETCKKKSRLKKIEMH